MDESFSIEELAERVGIPVRTVRYYIAEGLVPGPRSRGKGARYGPEHLSRLLLVRRLTAQHVPLAAIRERLAGLGERRLRKEAEAPLRTSPRAYLEGLLAQVRTPPPPPPAETWKRYRLADGLEVNLRSDLEEHYAPLLARLAAML